MRHKVDGKRENYSRVLLRAHAVQSLQVMLMIMISKRNVDTDRGHTF